MSFLRIPVFVAVLACVLPAATIGPADAQQSGRGATDAGKIQERIERPKAEPKTVAPIEAPADVPRAAAPSAELFRLIGAEIVGSTVYTPERLGDFYEPYLGREISLVDVETIVNSITEQYRRDGYFLSRAIAPPQGAEFGVLRIQVVEGFIETVAIEGELPGRADLFETWKSRITAERPLKLTTLERNLLLMADVPGLTVKPNVRAIDADTGAYRLDIRLEHAPVTGFVTLDNRGTTPVGPLQTYAGFNADSVLGLLERTRLAVFTVPPTPEELLYLEFQQTHFLNSFGTQGWFFASRSSVDSGLAGTDSKENSHGTRLLVGLSHPFVRTRESNLYVNLKFDVFDSDKNSNTDVYDDKLRVLRGGAAYSVNDGFGGANWLSFEISKGFDILHATDRDSTLVSVTGGRADFHKATVDLTRLQKIVEDVQLQLSAVGQWSPFTLLSSEQFSVGGQRFGRAYDPADISGDQGYAGSAELQYNPPFKAPFLKSLQLYGFYDYGAVWGTGFTRETMASAGGGIRFSLPRYLDAAIEVARPLTRSAAPGEDDGEDPRIFFSLHATF